MHKAIETLQSHNIPTHSYLAAVKYLGEETHQLQPTEYRSRITELCGHTVDVDDKFVRHHYLYLVQETVRRSLNTDKLDMDELFELATARANKYIRTNPWIFVESETEPKLDAAGNPKPKKGAKKEQAIALYKKMVNENNGNHPSRQNAIKRFVDEVGMTPAGASTYVANCKKNFGKIW